MICGPSWCISCRRQSRGYRNCPPPIVRYERGPSAHSARVSPGVREELSIIIAQRLKLEQQIDHMASKLCILGFEPLK
jgi:hypothetical protein